MPQGDKTKEPAFAIWKEGKSLKEIQEEITRKSGTLPGSVGGWVKDWERGRQETWEPTL